MDKIKKFKNFINESAILTVEPDWENLEEELYKYTLDFLPENIREWTRVKEQVIRLKNLYKSVSVEKFPKGFDPLFKDEWNAGPFNSWILQGDPFKHSLLEILNDARANNLNQIRTIFRKHGFPLQALNSMRDDILSYIKKLRDNNDNTTVSKSYLSSDAFKSFIKSAKTLITLHNKLVKGWDMDGQIIDGDPEWWLRKQTNSPERFGDEWSDMTAIWPAICNYKSSRSHDEYSYIKRFVNLFNKVALSKNISVEELYHMWNETIDLIKEVRKNNKNGGLAVLFPEWGIIKPTENKIFNTLEVRRLVKEGKRKFIFDATQRIWKAKKSSLPADIVNSMDVVRRMEITSDGPVDKSIPLYLFEEGKEDHEIFMDTRYMYLNSQLPGCKIKVRKNSAIELDGNDNERCCKWIIENVVNLNDVTIVVFHSKDKLKEICNGKVKINDVHAWAEETVDMSLEEWKSIKNYN